MNGGNYGNYHDNLDEKYQVGTCHLCSSEFYYLNGVYFYPENICSCYDHEYNNHEIVGISMCQHCNNRYCYSNYTNYFLDSECYCNSRKYDYSSTYYAQQCNDVDYDSDDNISVNYIDNHYFMEYKYDPNSDPCYNKSDDFITNQSLSNLSILINNITKFKTSIKTYKGYLKNFDWDFVETKRLGLPEIRKCKMSTVSLIDWKIFKSLHFYGYTMTEWVIFFIHMKLDWITLPNDILRIIITLYKSCILMDIIGHANKKQTLLK
jgi:hypothetical protein